MFVKNKRLILFISIIVFFVVLLTCLNRNKFEGDELIYQTLAIKIENLQPYSLQNTEILKTIPREIYNTKIFFYPPTFIILLSLFHIFLGQIGFQILPLVIYILFCFIIYKTVFQLTNSEDQALKAYILSVFSSMALFASVRGSMDLFMSLTTLISFYFLVLLYKYKKNKYIFLSGLFICISILTKYVPVIALIFYVPILIQILNRNKNLKNIYLFFIPFFLIPLWFIVLFQSNPSFSFFIHSQGSKVLQIYRFLDYAYHRPVYFYFLNTFIVNPLYLFIFILLWKKKFFDLVGKQGFLIYFLILFILFLSLVFTIIGVLGGTFQMRYLLLIEPFLIILISFINFEKYKLARILFILFMVHNLSLFFLNTVLLNFPENFSLFELMRISTLGKL